MKCSSFSVTALLLVFVFSATFCDFTVADEPFMLDNGNELIFTKASWSGRNPDPEARKFGPTNGMITDCKSWKSLWSQWRPDRPLPQINFTDAIVLVATVKGPRGVLVGQLEKDLKGNLTYPTFGTRTSGPGFEFILLRVSRKGISNVNGNKIPGLVPSTKLESTKSKVSTLQKRLPRVGVAMDSEYIIAGCQA